MSNERRLKQETLCRLLDRLGGDSPPLMMNDVDPEIIEDEVFFHVQHLEERARREVK